MGHIRLGELPKTRQWSQVIRLMDDENASVDAVAGAVVLAAEKAYRRRAVKVVIAARTLDPEHALASDDLALLRTALDEGRAPINELGRVLGRRLSRGVAAGGAIYEDDLL